MNIDYNIGENIYKNWIVAETDFTSENSSKFETIFSLGNGYIGLRASTEEGAPGEVRGSYVAGLFDSFPGENTELPNIPDWTKIEIKLDGEIFSLCRGKILSYQRQLNMRDGELVRSIEWLSPSGKKTKLIFRRFVSMCDLNTAAIKVEIRPVNYAGIVEILSGIDGQITNSGVQHFKEGKFRRHKNGTVSITSRTQESNIGLAVAVKHIFPLNEDGSLPVEHVKTGRRQIFLSSRHKIEEGQTFSLEKLVSVCSSRDSEFRDHKFGKNENISDKELEKNTIKKLKKAVGLGYDRLFDDHKKKWNKIWGKSDIPIDGPDFDQLGIRFSIFHIHQMTPAHDERIGIAAKGLSGEGYKGHAFWDTEIFLLPVHIFTSPETAKKLLLYRYVTLLGARKKALENGFKGAMYSWESADTGVEETPKWGAVDIETGEQIRIWSGDLEIHITSDVVYSIWQYFQVTQDYDFMFRYGLEIMLDTSRFWASRLEYNKVKDNYEINDVMGPDEYSEHVDNNAFTNYMVKWQMEKTLKFTEWIIENKANVWTKVSTKLNFATDELDDWKEKAGKIYFAIDEDTGFIQQYEGFTDKKMINLSKYRGKVGAIMEDYSWEDVVHSQVLKQADVVMLLYLAGDDFSREIKKVNWDYYEPITLHDSSLSAGMHSIVAADMDDVEKGYEYFQESIRIDLGENMQSCDTGLHAASHGGNWQAVVNGFGGIRITGDGTLRVNPHLPKEWNSLQFNLTWRGTECHFDITKKELFLKPLSAITKPFCVEVDSKEYLLDNSEGLRISYR
ncbi:MAG: glycoside hydrolase family 65 protein [Spirochaetes bacterium]|nr:MAG: glycoside hydrolase family 65 protein [Spirochaetota bacterium]